jgi:hypothetical protein
VTGTWIVREIFVRHQRQLTRGNHPTFTRSACNPFPLKKLDGAMIATVICIAAWASLGVIVVLILLA